MKPLQFDSGLLSGEAPLDSCPLLIALVLPNFNLVFEGFEVSNALLQVQLELA